MMPDPLHSSSDVPEFSTYPEEPLAQAPSLESTYRTYRRYSEPEGNRFMEPARRIGTTIGEAVSSLRQGLRGIRAHGTLTTEAGTRRLARLADERPLQVLLGVAAAGLAAGIGIRIWRNND
jgi:hypothetical protein